MLYVFDFFQFFLILKLNRFQIIQVLKTLKSCFKSLNGMDVFVVDKRFLKKEEKEFD